MRRTRTRHPAIAAAITLALLLAGCSGGPGPVSTGTMGPDDLAVVSAGMQFEPRSLTARAGRPFAIWFENRDSAPHNVSVQDSTGATVLQGDVFRGPAVRVYPVPALAAGTYTFICDLHPNMTGTIIAG